MTTLIIGANGRIGRRPCKQAVRPSVTDIILRPGRLSDDKDSGCIETNADHDTAGDISRDNVAMVLLALLTRETPTPRELVLLDGNRPIEQVPG